VNPLAADLDHVLGHTEAVWKRLQGARIFLTGGTGFFGSWLLETFIYANATLRLKARAVVLTRSAEDFGRKAPHLAHATGVDLLQGSITDFHFPDGEFSHVIHAAVDYSEPLRLFQSIVDGTRRTLDFAVHARAQRYLFTSSGAVYGKQPAELSGLPETYGGAPDTMEPASTYGEAKRAAEILCRLFNEFHAIEATVARGFAFVGPYLPLNAGSAIGNFIGDVLAQRPIIVSGDGTPYRSYLYGADLAIWLWTILCSGQPGRAYNVGSDTAIDIRDVAYTVRSVLDVKAEVSIARSATVGRLPERYVPSIQRARTELGLESWIDLPDAIRRTAEWYRAVK
jgi:nucleoside-diphosphate-sugar epimerase